MGRRKYLLAGVRFTSEILETHILWGCYHRYPECLDQLLTKIQDKEEKETKANRCTVLYRVASTS